MFKPNNIINAAALIPEALISDTMRNCYKDLRDMGWRFYVVDAKCGRCYYHDKVITIPLWLWDSEKIDANLIHALHKAPTLTERIQYRAWYIAHEMAHAFCHISHGGDKDPHGPKFMNELKMICPPNCIHFELSYKPKNAMAAGIMPHDF